MATELAKAYVQIIPSAQGIQGKITEALGGDGSSAGQSYGGKLVGAIKGIIGAAAIGKALAATITQGAELQQSLGGIETLFGAGGKTLEQYAAATGRTVDEASADYSKLMASQSTMLENAGNAYKTAGLSANDYMKTVTGFSASLPQGLGGDTSKAADVANMAITDMSDNANKMGTDMQSIQYAYQGFAKQNYTMLDNLKIGYGGTKTEMQRLLADAQKVTGVKYDISNLSDVYSAIHVIQGELDITGTTAKEASSTISGSFSSLKSAFTNVLGNLTLGADMGPSLDALVSTATTFVVGNLIPAVLNILKALIPASITLIQTALPGLLSAVLQFVPQLLSGLISAAPMLMTAAGQLLQQFCAAITTDLPIVLQQGQTLLTQLITGIITNLPMLLQTAVTTLSTFGESIISSLPQIMDEGVSIIMMLCDGIQQSLPQIITAAGTLVANLLSSIIEHLPEIVAGGFQLIISLIVGIGNALPGIVTAAGKVAGKLWDTIKKTDWLQLGKSIIQGMIDGIGAMGSALWDAAKAVASSALDAIKSFFGIHSPSTVMRDKVGKFIPLGLAEGIMENIRPVTAAMRAMTDLATGSLTSRLTVQLAGTAVRSPRPALAGAGTTNYYQTINTHDSLSPYELTREAEDLLERSRWKNP